MSRRICFPCTLALLLATRLALPAQPVQVDPAFAPVIASESQALEGTTFTATPDARLFAIGYFTHVDGTAVGTSGMVRLLADGSLDPGFSATFGAGEYAHSTLALADGRALVVLANGVKQIVPAPPTITPVTLPLDPTVPTVPVPLVPSGRIVRLLANGHNDPSFAPVTVFNGDANLAAQSDGSVIVWGSFAAVNGVPRNGLARISADGSVDASFAPALSSSQLEVQSLVSAGNGRVVLSAVSYSPSGTASYFFVRLTSAGTVDSTFAPAPVGRTFALLAALSDGGILAGNGDLAHFNADGSRDSAFTAQIPALANIDRLAVLPGDRLAVDARTGLAGANTINSVFILMPNGTLERDFRDLPGGERIQHLCAVLPDGRVAILQGPLTLAPAPWMELSYYEIPAMATPKLCVVDPAAGTLSTLPTTITHRDRGSVSNLRLDAAGRVLVEGNFTHIDGQPRSGSARFTADGVLDPAFLPVAVSRRAIQSGGRIIGLQTTLGPADADGYHRNQSRLVRLLADGTIDPTFAPPADLDLLSANWLWVEPDGHMLVSVFEPDDQREENLKLVWLADDGHRLTTLPTVFSDFTLLIVITADGDSITPASIGGGGWRVANVVSAATRLANGQLLVAAAANKVNGLSRPVLVRLNADGSVDQSYQPDLSALAPATRAQPLPDGRAIIYGARWVNGALVSNFSLRLNADGAVDPTYDPTVGRGQRLADGSYFYHGRRYHADGSLDLNFNPAFDNIPATAVLTADGRLWVGGAFTTVDGQPHAALVRFNLVETAGFTVMPVSRTLVAGRDVTFQAALGTSAPATYQWTFNGAAIPGGTDSVLTLRRIRPDQAGAYRLVATTGGQTYTSDAATLTVSINTARLVNFSARSRVSPDKPPQIGGFVLRDPAPHPILLRAIGRGLTDLGVPRESNLLMPVLRVHNKNGMLAENAGGALAPGIAALALRVGAFPDPSYSLYSVPAPPTFITLSEPTHDSALSLPLSAGPYTAHTYSGNGQAGISLFEFYDADTSTPAPTVLNFSIRGQAATGGNVLIAGFVITGSGPLTLLIRGIGPGLAPFGVTSVLADPSLTLYSGSNVYATNDNWSDQPEAALVAAAAQSAGAFALPAGSLDAALLVTLEPGAYTVQGGGPAGTAGEMMIELYVVY